MPPNDTLDTTSLDALLDGVLALGRAGSSVGAVEERLSPLEVSGDQQYWVLSVLNDLPRILVSLDDTDNTDCIVLCSVQFSACPCPKLHSEPMVKAYSTAKAVCIP